MSDDENSDSDESIGPDKSLAAKLRELGSDSGSDDDERLKAAPGGGTKDEKALFGSDSDSGEDEEE